MRLFLASQDFGSHVDRLHKMTGGNEKTLLIFNARDYKTNKDRNEAIDRKTKLFKSVGFSDVTELDLRNYFNKPTELIDYLDNCRPGLIFVFGGNYFVLRRAFALSGFDNKLIRDLKNDKYVYAGGSAGSMIATPSLQYYDDDKQKINMTPAGYSSDIIMDGLNLINLYLIPHANNIDHKEKTKKYSHNVEISGNKYLLLNDSDVFVVDGEKEEVLR